MRLLIIFSLLFLPLTQSLASSGTFMERVQGKGFFGKNIGYMGSHQPDNYAFPITLKNGEKVIITGASDLIHAAMNHLVLIRFNPENNSYYIDKTSKFFPGYFDDVQLFNISSENRTEPRLYAINSTNEHALTNSVLEFDPETLAIKQAFRPEDPGLAVGVRSLYYSDINNDGTNEMILGADHALWIVDPDNWGNYRKIDFLEAGIRDHKRSTSTYFVVGDTNSDGRNEIVFSDGSTFSLGSDDKAVFTGRFDVNPIFNKRRIVIDDIDNDGSNEVLFEDGDEASAGAITVFNGTDRSLKATINTARNILSFVLEDIDGDGRKELFLTSPYDSVRVYDTTSGEFIFEFSDIGYGGSGMVIDDLDRDGSKELLFGDGYNSSGPYKFLAYDLVTRAKKWESREANPIYRVLAHDAIANELIATSAARDSSSFKLGYVFFLDSDTLQEKKRIDLEALFADAKGTLTGLDSALYEDLDGDGDFELVIARLAAYDATRIAIIDPVSGSLLHDFPIVPFDPYSGEFPLSTLKASDIDDDGVKELLIGSRRKATGDGSSGFFVVDYPSGEILYRYNTGTGPTTFDSIYDIEVLPPGHDKPAQIFFLASGALYNVDSLSSPPRMLTSGGISTIAAVGPESPSLLFAGGGDGYLYRIDPEAAEIEQLGYLCSRTFNNVEEGDVVTGLLPVRAEGAATEKLLFTCGWSIGVYDLNLGKTVWSEYVSVAKNLALAESAYRLRDGVFSFFLGGATGVDLYRDLDIDADGLGNLLDNDDDGDGILDGFDAYPLDGTRWVLEDFDGDGIGDDDDPDDDNDGVPDGQDAFPRNAEESADTDGDQLGNNQDEDDDNDGMPDAWEIKFGLDPLNADDAYGDPDQDGVNNFAEYQAGTDPHSAPAPPPAPEPKTSSSSGGSLDLFLLALLALGLVNWKNQKGVTQKGHPITEKCR